MYYTICLIKTYFFSFINFFYLILRNRLNLNFIIIIIMILKFWVIIQWNYRSLSVCRSESNRIKYEFVTANRTRTFLLFLCFFSKSSVRFDRNELQNWLNMMHSSHEDIELCWIDEFGYGSPWQNRISSTVRFGSVRFGSKIY